MSDRPDAIKYRPVDKELRHMTKWELIDEMLEWWEELELLTKLLMVEQHNSK